MCIAIGCDEAGWVLKEKLLEYLRSKGVEVEDFGAYDQNPILYPDIAYKVAKSISEGRYKKGILICGTGIGMAITANKVQGIRAAVCHDPYSTERSRKSNDVQIMALGARVVGEELAKLLLSIWLESEFLGGASTEKVNRIHYYEKESIKENL